MFCLGARHTFALVDDAPVMWISVAVLIVPLLAGAAWVAIPWNKLVWCDFAALFVMSLSLVGNGMLDNAVPEHVRATVVHRSSSQLRSRASYELTVSPSWRPGRRTETLSISRTVYNRIHDLDEISIDVHPGYFHLPWYDHVSPAGASN